MSKNRNDGANGKVMVIFDWDGTIIDSVNNLYSGVCGVFCMAGIKPPSLAEYARALGSPYTDFFRRYGVTASNEQIWSWYLSATDGKTAELFWDVPKTLNTLRMMDVQMAIVSGQRTEAITNYQDFQSISKFFVSVSGYHEEKRDAILKTFGVFQVPGWRVLYVGDFCADMRDARQAGVVPVGITRGHATKGYLIDAGATFCIEHLKELIPIVQAMAPSSAGQVGD